MMGNGAKVEDVVGCEHVKGIFFTDGNFAANFFGNAAECFIL
jgi:hypothetical protein